MEHEKVASFFFVGGRGGGMSFLLCQLAMLPRRVAYCVMVETSFMQSKSKKGYHGRKRQYFVGVTAARDNANKTRFLV